MPHPTRLSCLEIMEANNQQDYDPEMCWPSMHDANLHQGQVTANYTKAINFLFMGGLMMAIAVENSGLHRRISLIMLRFFGVGSERIMFSFMLATGMLSMFISNTASTAMMIPIAEAVVATVDQAEKSKKREVELRGSADGTDQEAAEGLSPSAVRKRKMLMLSVAYAANVGGTGFLTGSPPNLVLPQVLSDEYPNQPLEFLTWSAFSLPLMLVNLALAFAWLWLYDRWSSRRKAKIASTANDGAGDREDDGAKRLNGDASRPDDGDDSAVNKQLEEIVREQYESLGSWKGAEVVVGTSFLALLALWLFKKPGGVKGWIALFPYEGIVIHDATATILMVLIVFALPTGLHFWPFQPLSEEPRNSTPLLRWDGEGGVEKKLAWGVILLLGGGFALSEACQKSGLSSLIGNKLSTILEGMPGVVAVFVLCALTATFTEFASNTATANILVPILVSTSRRLCYNPIYITLPAVLSCSYAFMLPAATAPNAIVKETSGISTFTMIKVGAVMNVVCVLTTTLFLVSWGLVVFDLDGIPEWLTENNNTDYAHCVES